MRKPENATCNLQIQVFHAPIGVLHTDGFCADVGYSHDEAQRCKQKPCVEGYLAFFHEPAGRAMNHGRGAVFVGGAFQAT